MTDQLEVTQEDREAAATMLEVFYGNSERYWVEQIRAGVRDNEAHTQSFARHRILHSEDYLYTTWLASGVADGLTPEQTGRFSARLRRKEAERAATKSGDWIMVPRDPTEAMRVAVAEFVNGTQEYDPEPFFNGIWSAMLAARPASPAVSGGEVEEARAFVEGLALAANRIGDHRNQRICSTLLAALPSVSGEGK